MIKDIIIVVLAGLLATGWLISTVENGNSVRVYDCGMAEWHPDIPDAVKQECRKRNAENWKQNNLKNPI